MITLSMPIIVEGKYDKIRLKSLIDSAVIDIGGFKIYHDTEKLNLIKRLADKTGVIILTDSDAAGFQIRSFLKSAISAEKIVNVYIPDVMGKERRKTKPGAEGKIGVEGMDTAVLLEAFERAGVIGSVRKSTGGVTAADLYEDGITGRPGCTELRRKFIKELALPEHISSKSLLEVINTLLNLQEYKKIVEICKNSLRR